MKQFILSAVCFLTIYIVGNAQNSVMSPNSLVEAKVEVGSQIVFSVYFNGKPVIANSEIRFIFKQAPPIGNDMIVLKTSSKVINETWTPVLKRTATILNNYRELTLQMQEKKFPRRMMNLVFRVFDDGVAFRTEFIGSGNNHDYVITDELVTFNFTADHTCWAANHGNYRSSQENEYFKRNLSDITDQMVIGLPMTVKVADDCYAAITEANITDYAGMYLKQGHSKTGFSVRSNLAPLPDQPETGDKVRFKFPHKTPWRVIMLGDTPGKLIESEIVMNLNEPCAIADPSWIKPGICAWDHWWSGEVKVDNETIKKYIALASEMG
ncbi:MAG: glycoside hydrolase family 97 N-terminal domain-containing protein, partial [Bacteroidota bacterium]|nr:glycoside hydrolase family 97 N-terminal domain-containing protein [Bacteroidota bacterium]